MYNFLHIHRFLRSHDTGALSYLRGTNFKLDNKDIVLETSLENFLLCLGIGYSRPHFIQQCKKFIWTHFEVRLEQTT